MNKAPHKNPRFFKKLQDKWKLESIGQLVMVLLVFACTGMTVLYIKQPILGFFGVSMDEGGLWKTMLYLLLVLPLYQLFLLVYGFLFGQFAFFWEKEKKFLKRIWKLVPSKSVSQRFEKE